MPFNPSVELPIPLGQLNDCIPWLPSKPHTSTWFRWAQVGLRGHKLEVIRVPGSGLCTSEPAVRRFIEKMTATPNAAHGAEAVTSAA